ncbi:MAG: sigma-70 family RNA polymerase sigma factor [Planctomycetes bacterium]|nr:sigma-70 family RNA polymerase sigma factor [Planctomycetota bacterium]
MHGPESTCWTLVEHAAAGDGAAREEFGRRYLPVVRAYLHARWSGRLAAEELEDAVQDVFVAFLREQGVLENLRPGRQEAFRPLLYAVVRNMALRIEHARARRLDRPGSESFRAEEKPSSEEALSRVFDRAWAASIMREALDLQEDLARSQGEDATRRFELLRLLFDQELSIPKIAERWGVDAELLHKEAARAKREFKEALRSVVAFHHPEAPELVERECRELLTLLG